MAAKANPVPVPRRIALREAAKGTGEVPDPTPIVHNVPKPLTLREEMQRFIREELSAQIQEHEMDTDTFEEFDDFEIDDDDPDLTTGYTVSEFTEDPHGDDLDGKPTKEDLQADKERIAAEERSQALSAVLGNMSDEDKAFLVQQLTQAQEPPQAEAEPQPD